MDRERVNEFTQHFTLWARSQPDILAVAMVGSYARGQARPDSDLDLVLVCKRPQEYVAHTNWVLEFGRVLGRRLENYGRVTSVRVWYEDGLEVEYGIAAEDWAASPLDAGTRQVISDGMRVLYEQDRILSRHLPAQQTRKRAAGPP